MITDLRKSNCIWVTYIFKRYYNVILLLYYLGSLTIDQKTKYETHFMGT